MSRSAPRALLAAIVAATLLAMALRAPAWSAAPAPARALATPVPTDTSAFAMFGWLSPPPESTNADRIDQMSQLSFNLALPAWRDSGRVADNLARLDLAAVHGMRCLIWDARMNGAWHWLPTFEDTLDQIVADYRNHPGFWGYYLGDEPPSWEWPLLHRLREALRKRDPVHPAWNNLSGRVIYADRVSFQDTLRAYADAFHPAVLCADHYDFTVTGDRGEFVENVVGLRAEADSLGLPFWAIIQLIPHAVYRPLHPGELRWQVSELLAYGARGIGYFTYWPPDPDPAWNWGMTLIGYDGRPTSWYDLVRALDSSVRSAGQTLARSRWRRTTHSGSVPAGGAPFTPDDWIADATGRAAIGEFEGANRERWLLVANSDSSASQMIGLDLRGLATTPLAAGSSIVFLPPVTASDSLITRFELEPGGFVLLKIESPASGGSSLLVTPNPGTSAVSFSMQVSWPNALLEILDTAGRRIWSRPLAEGPASLQWHGERDSGGAARPGIYFVRVTGTSASAARRFVWLGSR